MTSRPVKAAQVAVAKYLTIWPEHKLIELREHCEQGKFCFASCSCLLGAFDAPHKLGTGTLADGSYCNRIHLYHARQTRFASDAEDRVCDLLEDSIRAALIIQAIDHELESRRGIPVNFPLATKKLQEVAR